MDMVPGSYIVRAEQQSGRVQTHAPTVPITLDLDEQVVGADFGFAMQLAMPGDYNLDATVDLSDYIVWRKSMDQTVPPFSGADGDGDGIVDQDDYDVWRAHFGMTTSPAGASAHTGSVAQAAAPYVPAAIAKATNGVPPVASAESTDVTYSVFEAGPGAVSGKSSIGSGVLDSGFDAAPMTSASRGSSRPAVSPALDAWSSSLYIALVEWLSPARDASKHDHGAAIQLDHESPHAFESESFESIDAAIEMLSALASL
jgi:hypothetical protein